MEWLINLASGIFTVEFFTIATSVIGTFAVIATVTPNKVDDKIGQILMDGINFLAANFGKAKNNPEE